MTPEGVHIKNTDKIWIGGEWVAAHSKREIELVSPNSEEVIGSVAEANEADMDGSRGGAFCF